MWDQYYTVSTIEETLQLLAEYRERARIIAGGTDILIEMERGQRPNVDVLIDITRIKGLDEIRLEDGVFHLGCLVTHNHVVGNSRIVEQALPLAQASWEVGAPQIRNRATIAGNLITASPANDTISPLITMDAQITLVSVKGERQVALKDFYTGLRKHIMQPDEMLLDITFPAMTENERGVFLKLGLRRAQAISVVNATVILTFDADEVVTKAAIALGSVAPTIIRIPQAEEALVGNKLTTELMAEVARLTANIPTPIDDVRSTAAYRSEMIKVFIMRGLRQIAANEQGKTFPETPAMLWGDHEARVQEGFAQQVNHSDHQPIEAIINGEKMIIETGQHKTLLDWLREDAKLPGSKEGCAEGECGACTVFLDDVAVMSCMVAAPRAHQADIVTVEGLKHNGTLHPIQRAFIDDAAVQCGYCTPGFLMAGAKLLDEHPKPSDDQINQSISGNLCRCTGYYNIVKAFKSASQSQRVENE